MKHISMLLFVITISIMSFGQLVIKPKAGMNISQMQTQKTDFSWQDNQVPKVRFHVGLALEYPIFNQIKVQAELLYTQKGLKDTSHIPSRFLGSPAHKGYGYNFHYLEVPVLIRFPFSSGFHLGVGPSIAYLLKTDNILGGEKVNSQDLTFTKFDYGINGDLSFSFKQLEIGARYNHSFATLKYSSTSNDPELFLPNNEVIGKNRVFQLYFGYRF